MQFSLETWTTRTKTEEGTIWGSRQKGRFGSFAERFWKIFDLSSFTCSLRSAEKPDKEDSVVIIVSPLNALIEDQMQKLEKYLNICVIQSVVEEEGENKVTFTN